jgi:hypothetical protein
MASQQPPVAFEVTPSAARLTESLRDIGYDFPTAVADLVDNSVAAQATNIAVDIDFDGVDSSVSIIDDGVGMTANGLVEALRYGTRRDYSVGELGRYGLGLKTAPLSQCRRVTVVSRRSKINSVITRRSLDLDLVADWDRWMVVELPPTDAVSRAGAALSDGPGTAVVWEKLDRVLPESRPDGGWAKRRLESLAVKTAAHLGMVFHRFLEGNAGGRQLVITVNGEKVRAWNPFAPDEPYTTILPEQIFEVSNGGGTGYVALGRHVLPPRNKFSSAPEFDRLSGPLKWNRQQGLYIYRSNRLVQWGGWSGIRAIDEHTKLARASLDFDTDLDGLFHINVAKMRVSVPTSLRQMLERPIHELCVRADDVYRKTARVESNGRLPTRSEGRNTPSNITGLALQAAAMELGHSQALQEIVTLLKGRDPDLVASLGLDCI